MDHEIEDHRHVGAPRLERGQPLGLEKPRLVEIGGGGAHCAVEPLHVPDLKQDARLGGFGHQRLGALETVGERLFDQRVPPAAEDLEPDRRVRRRGDGDGHGIHGLDQRRERRKRDGLQLLGDLGGARRVDVEDADQRGVGDRTQQPRVMVAEGAGADHADPHRPPTLHTITPRCDASMKLRNFSTSGTWGSSIRARAIPWLTVRSELNSRR